MDRASLVLNIYESCHKGYISIDEMNDLINITESYFSEKEEDHSSHIKYKEIASAKKNIPIDKMTNKKYQKDPEKADLYYKGREQLISKDKSLNNGNNYVRKKPVDDSRSDIDDNGYDKYYHDIELKDKDIATKALAYMHSHANLKNPKEQHKYKIAFNIFCRRFHIPENSSLWIKYNPGGDPITYDGKTYKIPDKMTVGAYEDKEGVKIKDSENSSKKTLSEKFKERKLKLPNGYKLLHESNAKHLTHLKPKNYSDNYIGSGPGKIAGQYHSTGRIYFTLVKDRSGLPKSSYDKDSLSYGDNVYELVDSVDYIYFDTEHNRAFEKEDLDKITIDKLLNKPVYVKTNTPLRVKKYKGD